jgi:D-proline reductase (dithiol) PrdB
MAILKDLPIDYIERTEKYYLALGYNNPYTWANFNDIPFVKLRKPLFDCRISLVTTASPYQVGKGDQDPGAPYNAEAKFHDVYSMNISENPDVRISHIAIDRDNTTAEDIIPGFPWCS